MPDPATGEWTVSLRKPTKATLLVADRPYLTPHAYLEWEARQPGRIVRFWRGGPFDARAFYAG